MLLLSRFIENLTRSHSNCAQLVALLFICIKKCQLADWLRAGQLKPNSAEYSVYKVEIECGKLIFNCIYSDNRTEWSPIRSVIVRVIKNNGRQRSGSPIY